MKTILPNLLLDSYKISHKDQYPEGTTLVYSNLTARSGKYLDNSKYAIFVGLQYFIKEYLIDQFNNNFFSRPKDEVINEYRRVVKNHLGSVNSEHIEALHDLGYLPIKIKALPEGTKVPIRTPMLVIYNTHPDFFWLTNSLETLMSNILWKPIVSATIADKYREVFDAYARDTCDGDDLVLFQGHDFSMRGLVGIEYTCLSAFGHICSFCGSDTVPVIPFVENYYNTNSDKELVAVSVPASEHSVQCLHGVNGERVDEDAYVDHMLTTYPNGIVSVVSDGFDYWKMLTETLPKFRDRIMSREGKYVVRPDCYDDQTQIMTDTGWKYFKDLTDQDLVGQVLDDGSIEYVKPSKIIRQNYNGDMYHFYDTHGKLDLLVTPNHRMMFYKNGKWVVQEASQAKVGQWGKDMVRSAKEKHLGRTLTDLEKLKIAFQADGSYTTSGNKIRFSFSKVRKINRLKDILNNLKLKYKIYPLKEGKVEFNIDISADYFGKDFSWVDCQNLCSNWSQEFIEEASYWDATRRHDERFKIDTTNKEVIEIIERVALAAGYGILITEKEDNRKDIFSNVFTAHILKNNKIGGQSQNIDIQKYSGYVNCVTVPSGRILVKRNRCTLVSGNSGDPVEIVCGEEIMDITQEYNKYYKDSDQLENYCAEIVESKINSITPHGEHGGDLTMKFKYENKYYQCYVDPNWNRYDKQYYYIDGIWKKELKEIELTPEEKGSVEVLWDLFGGTFNSKGYKELDPHIGLIYGDSITLDRQSKILSRLKAKGFASSNIVLGIGSFTYAMNTRDTLGLAVKATYGEVDGQPRPIFKDPKTDDGMKKSARGLIRVNEDLSYTDGVSWSKEGGLLTTVFENGNLLRETSLREIRERLSK